MGVTTMVDLMLRYPAIRLFVRNCYIYNEIDKLFDFLMEIQTEDEFLNEVN